MVDCVLYVEVPCSHAVPLLRTYEHRDFLYTSVNECSYWSLTLRYRPYLISATTVCIILLRGYVVI